MRGYLEIENMAPDLHMWHVLEPGIETVRRRLARCFGCDPEEIAITRNASEALEIVQLGIDLKRGDEVLTTNQDYPRMITTWQQRERRDGIVLKQISFPVPPPSMDDLAKRFEDKHHAADEGHPFLPHHQPHRPDLPGEADLPDGARARHRGDRGRRARLRAVPVQAAPTWIAITTERQPAQMAAAPIGTGLPVCRRSRRSRRSGR